LSYSDECLIASALKLKAVGSLPATGHVSILTSSGESLPFVDYWFTYL